MLQGPQYFALIKHVHCRLLRQDILREALVITYLDINKMNKVLEILENTDDLCRISKRCQEKAIIGSIWENICVSLKRQSKAAQLKSKVSKKNWHIW